jgi:hypothetical protein
MKVALVGCVVGLIVLVSISAHALEPMVLYEDFNAVHIAPDKWFGVEHSLPGGTGTEALRQIQDNRLRLVYRGYGRTDSDSGGVFNGLGLTFRNSAAVTAIQATVQVNDVVAMACASNPKVTFPGGIYPWIGAWAGPHGHFFNTVTPPPGSAENDVAAFIGILRASDATDPPDVLRAVSLVFHCTSADCTAGSELDFKDLGPVKRGEIARLRVQWDRDNHRFIFQRDDNPEVVTPYTVSDTAPPGFQAKVLEALHLVPNCTASPRPAAFIDVLFDDLMVNESAALRSAR